MAKIVGAAALKSMLDDGGELALLDLREELIFSRGHLLHARSLPLSRLELRLDALVPRRTTRIVLCDDDDGLAARAAAKMAGFGYDDIAILEGGVASWAKAGGELFSGVFVPSKAFGEFVEHHEGTPSISAEELHRLQQAQADLVVLDSRPFEEFQRMSIPGGIDAPGAELVFRVREIAPRPETTIVVNCAGRTRSIIGAQSLINAGVPNKVMALRNGTMGWELAGLACEQGKERRAPDPLPHALAWAQEAAERVARRFGVERIDLATLRRFRDDRARTLYLFDVRDPRDYEKGHLPGARSAPGGQLVQATDQYVGTLGARIVLVDLQAVRAVMTASWLKQMGWREVFVLAAEGSETGRPTLAILGHEVRPDLQIGVVALLELMRAEQATIIDLSLSRSFRQGHIPGAWFAIRARLARALAKVRIRGTLVLTSEDGVLAGLAVPEAQALTAAPVRALAGGNAAWVASGRELMPGSVTMADDPIDAWLRPYDRAEGVEAAMKEYLSWEVGLLDQVRRDGSCPWAQ